MRRALHALAFVAIGVAGAGSAAAQTVDSARVAVRTTARATGAVPPAPPISPKRAFLYSLALPGYGQSRLDRGTSGALFASVELAALVMVRRSLADVREAKRYRLDSLPTQFTLVEGVFRPTGSTTGRFTRALVNTRRLHVEDWIALIAFNHLLSGADAFVAAQLWDVPLAVSARPVEGGAAVVATLRF